MTVVLLAGLEIGQVLLSLLSFAPDAPVEDAHDGDGRVEGGDGRAERDVIVCLDKLDEAFICLERERREKHTIRSGLDPLDKSERLSDRIGTQPVGAPHCYFSLGLICNNNSIDRS